MTALLTTGLFVAEQLMRYAPGLFVQFKEIISAPEVTAEEIRARRKVLAGQKFEDFVPHSELPPTSAPSALNESPG